METQSLQLLIIILLVVLFLFYLRKKKQQLPTSSPISQDRFHSTQPPNPAVVPTTSMGLIRSHIQNFVLINLPLDHSASLTYSTCSNSISDQMFCPKQGGVFLVQYDDSGMARFVSFVSEMDDYNQLVAIGVPTMIIALPSSAIYMGEFKPTA